MTTRPGGAGAEAAGYVGATLNPDRRPENQMAAVLGPEGLVARLQIAPADGPAFLKVLRAASNPFIAPDIVWPTGWLRDKDGRGYSVMEMEQWQKQQQNKAA